MSVRLIAAVSTLLLLSAVANRSLAKPSGTIAETKGGQMEEEKEEPSPANFKGENRQRQRELSRDTFLRLHPNPRGETDEGIGQNNANGEKAEEVEDGSQWPLRDGDTLLAFTSDDALIERTAQLNNCRGDLFKHKVRLPGCRPKTIVNRFCHGNCASFYIPRMRSKKLKATFQSCAACVPTETDLVQIQLDCPSRGEGQLNRTIVRVKKCACRNIALEGEEGKEDEAEEVNGQRHETETP
ncbi:hypothetical protein niasHS_010927 [Heterodera schachtii]|uniref:CTCK domain-containing protein n=1 Tax=Heterodera schachtii TaxID=97005 RepID=A0ABD2IZN8_HETSC